MSSSPLRRGDAARPGKRRVCEGVSAEVSARFGRRAGAAGPNGIALGVFLDGAPGDTAPIDAYVRSTGHAPAIVAWYQAWGGEHAAFEPGLLATVAARGATPLITWEPWVPGAGVEQPDVALARIAAGAFDPYIDTWASGLAAYGDPVLLRVGREMNGDWYPWAASVNGNDAMTFIAAWRHLHDRFDAAGARNVRWVWSPNIAYEGSTP
ncbi:MAG: beta-mannanase, partial [Thermomicrobiales bacterium]|nr:beta-mannanase [Thermomicrobiales bacterium]